MVVVSVSTTNDDLDVITVIGVTFMQSFITITMLSVAQLEIPESWRNISLSIKSCTNDCIDIVVLD